MQIIKPYPILLPKRLDERWAVVACDQFSSERGYWDDLDRAVGDAPSTLRMILPEVYLTKDNSARIRAVNATMRDYLNRDLFVECGGMILTQRATEYGHTRTGIVTCIDLEQYSFNPADRAAIRATEGTVISRIPPRVEIRRNAPIELPHVLMLIDDETNSVLDTVKKGKQLYDVELIAGGGHISGWSVDNETEVIAAFGRLLDNKTQKEKYGVDTGLLLAVGDGNHSLASAKAFWDEIKTGLSDKEREAHPARYALVEIENIYDEGILFEPIYRVVFGDVSGLSGFIVSKTGEGSGTLVTSDGDVPYGQMTACVDAVAQIDRLIAEYGETHEVTVDYVHGEDSVRELVKENKAVGVLLPSLAKSELFRVVANGGVLPRKTFSMGEAREKRYYCECKLLQRS